MMAEALDKASQELDKTVAACVEQLQSFHSNVEKSLANQLKKLLDQSKTFADSSFEDLSTHREELIDRLLEFERSEIETMISAARDVRQHVSSRAQRAIRFPASSMTR
jgi:predicted nucleotidyltransferase